MISAPPHPASRAPRSFALAAAVVCLLFAGFTGHIWEDYFITFRASLNLATGHGLVFQPGERVHTFTSPLGTLLPALFAVGGGDDVALRALWGLRVVSALAVGAAVWQALRGFQRHGLPDLITAGIGTVVVLDPKIVDFSINGMETGLVVVFVVFSWHAFVTGARIWPCALGCAGLQWTRPDGFVFFGALALAWTIFGHAEGSSLVSRASRVIRRIGLGVLLYIPWLAFTWTYYGSPVPHTILAKAQSHTPGEILQLLVNYPWRLVFGETNLHHVFIPAYFFMGGWPVAMEWVSRILATGAALAWIWPRVSPAGRIASGAFFLGGFYVAYIPIFPWYHPGWQVLGWLTWAFLLHTVWTLRPDRSWAAPLPRSLVRIATASIVGLQAILFVSVAWQMRTQQSMIEETHRAEIGRWLARNASSRDTVFLECLGYIGYYSKLKMLDFPGLSAPEVVAARKAGHRSYAQVIDALKPDWVVLRPREDAQVFGEIPALRKEYALAREFNTRARVDAVRILPGRNYLNFDSVFLVYHRLSAEAKP